MNHVSIPRSNLVSAPSLGLDLGLAPFTCRVASTQLLLIFAVKAETRKVSSTLSETAAVCFTGLQIVNPFSLFLLRFNKRGFTLKSFAVL